MAKILSYLDVDQKYVAPMTEEQSEMFLRCFFAERDAKQKGVLEPLDEEWASKLGDAGMIFYKRLAWQPPGSPIVTVSVPTTAFLLSLSGGIPGNIVMWAYTMNRYFNEHRKLIDTEDISMAFPWGFPTKEQALEIWDAQKVHKHGDVDAGRPGTDNMVDRPETWMLETV